MTVNNHIFMVNIVWFVLVLHADQSALFICFGNAKISGFEQFRLTFGSLLRRNHHMLLHMLYVDDYPGRKAFRSVVTRTRFFLSKRIFKGF